MNHRSFPPVAQGSLPFQPIRPPHQQGLPDRFLLQAHHYTDAGWRPVEQRAIFRRSWLYVGDGADLLPNHVWATSVAGVDILIARTADGNLRGFHNLCPHRAAQLCPTPGKYAQRQLVCPYHAWVYTLDGALKGTPARGQFAPGFEAVDYSLRPVRIDTWSDFIFVCFDDAPPPLTAYLGSIPCTLGQHRTAATCLLAQTRYTVACNWKNYHDNTLCDYHVAIAHRTTLSRVQGPLRYYRHRFDDYVNLLYTPTTPQWRQANSPLPHLRGASREGLFTYGIYPNLHLLGLPNGLLAWLQIVPRTVDSCELRLEIYGVPQNSPPAKDLLQEFDAFMQEDMAITQSVQRGYASGAYTPGPVNGLEARIVHQQQLIYEAIAGSLPGEKWEQSPGKIG